MTDVVIRVAAPLFMVVVLAMLPIYADIKRDDVDVNVRPGEQGSGPIDPAMDYIAIGACLFILLALLFTGWALDWLGVANPGAP